MLPVLALLAWLGTWQLHRAAEKRALFELFAHGTDATHPLPLPGAPVLPRYSHVRVSGRYVPGRQVLLDNMTHDGRAGFRVLTPLERDDGSTVLVDRGWVPLGRTRADLPDVAVGDAPRAVLGRVDLLPRPGIELATPPDGTGWPRVLGWPHLEQLARVLGRRPYPQIVLLDPSEPDGYVRAWQPSEFPPERHLAYAVQWFALALTLVAIWFVVHLRQKTPPR